MKLEHKEVEYCKLHVDYEADADVVSAKRDEAVASMRNTQVSGFRKGKAPDYAIKAKLGPQIDHWVINEMATHAYDDVVFETGIKPIGRPQINNLKLKGNKFTCDMFVFKKPEFELKTYADFEIPKPHMETDVQTLVENGLANIRYRFGEVLPYNEDDVVEKGDQITLSYEATIDAQPFEGGSAEGILCVVGERSQRMPGFDEQLAGMRAGESKDFDITVPQDVPEIGGKAINFHVLVHMGSKKKMAPLNDELIKACGVENLDDLRSKLTALSSEQLRIQENTELRRQVSERLVAAHDFEVPNFLVDGEAQSLAMQAGIMLESLPEKTQEALKESAKKNVQLSLILDAIRETEPDAVLSESEAHQALMKRVAVQGQDPNEFMVKSQKNGTLLGLITGLRDEYVLQWVIGKSKIVE
jgi:trigger factor